MIWRETMRSPRFLMFDARATFPLMLFFLHMTSVTFYTAVISMFIFTILERKGLTISAAFRAMRAKLCGKSRPAIAKDEKRHLIDYGA